MRHFLMTQKKRRGCTINSSITVGLYLRRGEFGAKISVAYCGGKGPTLRSTTTLARSLFLASVVLI